MLLGEVGAELRGMEGKGNLGFWQAPSPEGREDERGSAHASTDWPLWPV